MAKHMPQIHQFAHDRFSRFIRDDSMHLNNREIAFENLRHHDECLIRKHAGHMLMYTNFCCYHYQYDAMYIHSRTILRSWHMLL